jgi:hypothetical protein
MPSGQWNLDAKIPARIIFTSDGNRFGPGANGFRSGSDWNCPASDLNHDNSARNRRAARPKYHFAGSPSVFSNGSRLASGGKHFHSNGNCPEAGRKGRDSKVRVILPIGIAFIPIGMFLFPAGIALLPDGRALAGNDAVRLLLESRLGGPEK